jgi:hypothetical protein
MARVSTLKCFQGNLDGIRRGLVIASSQASAAKVAGCSVSAFRDYWNSAAPWPAGEFRPNTLYTCPMNSRTKSEWVEGRCVLLADN